MKRDFRFPKMYTMQSGWENTGIHPKPTSTRAEVCHSLFMKDAQQTVCSRSRARVSPSSRREGTPAGRERHDSESGASRPPAT